MTESYSSRRGARDWLMRRGQPQRAGDLVTVTKADRQNQIEAALNSMFRAGARRVP
jgi:hypothetical protein